MIAKGAYGNVIKVHKEDQKRFYAVKVLDKVQIIQEGAIRQCKEEAAIQVIVGYVTSGTLSSDSRPIGIFICVGLIVCSRIYCFFFFCPEQLGQLCSLYRIFLMSFGQLCCLYHILLMSFGQLVL